MADPKTKSNITPEQSYASFKKAKIELDNSQRVMTYRYRDGVGFTEKLRPDQKEAISNYVARSAEREATKLDGIVGIKDGIIGEGELTYNPNTRGSLAISQTWHEILTKMGSNQFPFVDDDLNKKMVPHSVLDEIRREKQEQNSRLSQRSEHEIVPYNIGDGLFKVTVKTAMRLNDDIANHTAVMTTLKNHEADFDLPIITPTIPNHTPPQGNPRHKQRLFRLL